MARRRSRDLSVFGLSFLDIMANTIGALAFLLTLAFAMINDPSPPPIPPKILTDALPVARHQETYSVWLSARGGGGVYSWAMSAPGLPAGLELDAASGRIHGTPLLATSDTSQAFVLGIECRSASGIDGKTLTLKIDRSSRMRKMPLTLVTASTLPPAFLGREYPLALSATGGQPPYRWQASNPPPGLRLGQDGILSGTANEEGVHQVDIGVTDDDGAKVSRLFSLEVVREYEPLPPPPPLRVLTDSMPPAVANRAYVVWLSATGGRPPYRWSVDTGSPKWLRQDEGEGEYSGTPSTGDIGIAPIVWEVTDREVTQALSAPMELRVLPPVPDEFEPLAILTELLPDARARSRYGLALSAKGGTGRYTWSGESLPKGLSLTPHGILGGMPQSPGIFTSTVTVHDGTGATSVRSLVFQVRPALSPVRILTQELARGRAGRPYSFSLSATGGYPPYRWVAESPLPSGLAVVDSTGQLHGIPAEAGRWELTFVVMDAEGTVSRDTLDAELTVLTPLDVPGLVVTTRAVPELRLGQAMEIALACEGGEVPYAWSAPNGLPAGLQIQDGRIMGTPSKAGSEEVTLRVLDASGQSAETRLAVIVSRVAPLWITILLAILLFGLLLWLVALLRRLKSIQSSVELTILTDSIPPARASSRYSVQLACMGGVAPYRWDLIDGGLPPGLTLSEDGRITGCPFEGISVREVKDFPITARVRDQAGATRTQRL